MSSIVSRRPSLRNQWNEAFWMSIRFGRSRTCFTREKDVRARGAATLAVKRYSLPQNGERIRKVGQAKTRNLGATCKGSEYQGGSARAAPKQAASGGMVARSERKGKRVRISLHGDARARPQPDS